MNKIFKISAIASLICTSSLSAATIQLNPGWNLISIPEQSNDLTLYSIWNNIQSNVSNNRKYVFAYDPRMKQYVGVGKNSTTGTIANTGAAPFNKFSWYDGFWVYTDNNATINSTSVVTTSDGAIVLPSSASTLAQAIQNSVKNSTWVLFGNPVSGVTPSSIMLSDSNISGVYPYNSLIQNWYASGDIIPVGAAFWAKVSNSYTINRPIIDFSAKTVKFDSVPSGNTIRYTLDGTTPTSGSTAYAAGSTIAYTTQTKLRYSLYNGTAYLGGSETGLTTADDGFATAVANSTISSIVQSAILSSGSSPYSLYFKFDGTGLTGTSDTCTTPTGACALSVLNTKIVDGSYVNVISSTIINQVINSGNFWIDVNASATIDLKTIDTTTTAIYFKPKSGVNAKLTYNGTTVAMQYPYIYKVAQNTITNLLNVPIKISSVCATNPCSNFSVPIWLQNLEIDIPTHGFPFALQTTTNLNVNITTGTLFGDGGGGSSYWTNWGAKAGAAGRIDCSQNATAGTIASDYGYGSPYNMGGMGGMGGCDNGGGGGGATNTFGVWGSGGGPGQPGKWNSGVVYNSPGVAGRGGDDIIGGTKGGYGAGYGGGPTGYGQFAYGNVGGGGVGGGGVGGGGAGSSQSGYFGSNAACAIGSTNVALTVNLYKNLLAVASTPNTSGVNAKICGYWYCEASGGLGSNLSFPSRWNGKSSANIGSLNNSDYYGTPTDNHGFYCYY